MRVRIGESFSFFPVCIKCHERFVDYEWLELWKAVIALLGFLASKLDHLTTTGGVENLIQEVGDESD